MEACIKISYTDLIRVEERLEPDELAFLKSKKIGEDSVTAHYYVADEPRVRYLLQYVVKK